MGFKAQNPIDIEVSRLIQKAKAYMSATTNEYHNTQHVEYMLSQLDRRKFDDVSQQDRWELQLAIAYHDVVYVPSAGYKIGPGVNEKMSALLFLRMAEMSSLYRAEDHSLNWITLKTDAVTVLKVNCLKVADMIERSTIADHLSDSEEQLSQTHKLFLDLDLLSLSEPWEVFLKNQEHIASEHVTPGDAEALKAVLLKQAEFLDLFLKKETIYRSGEFSRENDIARLNIARFVRRHRAPTYEVRGTHW